MKNKIGINAGIVRSCLEKSGETNLKDLKKACKLTEKDMYAALGWLAREEKVLLAEVDKETFAKLM